MHVCLSLHSSLEVLSPPWCGQGRGWARAHWTCTDLAREQWGTSDPLMSSFAVSFMDVSRPHLAVGQMRAQRPVRHWDQRASLPRRGAGKILPREHSNVHSNGSLGNCHQFTESATQHSDPDFALSIPACFATHRSRHSPSLLRTIGALKTWPPASE